MKGHVQNIEWVPASPEYILASIEEEWRQCALWEEDDEREQTTPGFATTVHEWRDAMDLVSWYDLGRALNKEWGTRFSWGQWREVLVPARERTLRDVCNLLSTAALRPLVRGPVLLGKRCHTAAVFLAIRTLLMKAGAPGNFRPSTPLEPFLQKWPKVFLDDIGRLAPGGVPYTRENWLGKVTGVGALLGVGCLVLGSIVKEPLLTIAGVLLFGSGWLFGLFGCSWFQGPLKVEKAATFRDLAELIVARQKRHGLVAGS